MMDATVDEVFGLDGTGPDAGCEGELIDEHAEFECNDDRDTNGVETSLFDAEELIEQLRVCNSALNIPSDATIHLARFVHAIRSCHMSIMKRDTSIPSYFKSI